MKKLCLSLFMVIIFGSLVYATSGNYVASKKAQPFHVPSCVSAQKISPKNAVWYQTAEEAIQDGHRPCKVCNPAVSGAKSSMASPAESMPLTQVTVDRVVDGDTISVAIDGKKVKVRLVGVNTPESVHPNKPVEYYGKEASAFTKKALTGKKVWLQVDVQPRDRYGRMLAYVWVDKPKDPDNEQEIRAKMFNARLLLEGYGQVMTIQPNSRYSDLFVVLQREAREANKGLWGKQ